MADESNEKPSGPFEEPDKTTDVTFVVEERKLYFNKTILMISSPVFERMFTADFKEKDAKEIPLPGKKFVDMVALLQQIHPVHCAQPITDTTLAQVLPLADEYQMEAVRKKCEQYIGTQMEIKKTELSNDTLLFYLCMCEQHQMKLHRERLLQLGAERRESDLEKSRYFDSVPSTAMRDLLIRRCKSLERFVYGNADNFKVLSAVVVHLREKCETDCNVFRCSTVCKTCIGRKEKAAVDDLRKNQMKPPAF
ncbi:hypothetical protein BaRGS_00003596 [Batillaria attramentaria]|uniref:BTB domain-containing protein n=1 Tax=Batillaria attramentaria TaxID=370345 RepID=A0ABD0M0I0_9CAEN